MEKKPDVLEPHKQSKTNTGSSMLEKLRESLSKTGIKFNLRIRSKVGQENIKAEMLEQLEMQLLSADVGIDTTSEILEKLLARMPKNDHDAGEELRATLRENLIEILSPSQLNLDVKNTRPFVILMVGANGSGKTTTIGKLAKYFSDRNYKVMLAAGDTYRAAASEQLSVWGERNSVPVVAQHQGADSASVVYDAFVSAAARGVDILIADTAGRLHNHEHLMEELKKIIRVIRKLDENAPHEIMLVLDAGAGQNALPQAMEFKKEIGTTGITLTKLDGTAKGGIIFSLARKLALPIRYIGIGEASEDIRPFVASEFVDALLDSNTSQS